MKLADDENMVMTALLFLEQYDGDMNEERKNGKRKNPKPVAWQSHEEGSKELLSRLQECADSGEVCFRELPTESPVAA